MAKTTVAIDLQAQTKGTESVKSLKTQIREATQEAIALSQKFGEFSPEAQNATKRVAELKDQMEDFQNRVAGVNPDKFSRIAGISQGIARGIQGATGALALFGVESEAAQQALVKVQAATAFAEGTQGLIELDEKMGGFVKTTIAGFKGIKGAIAATGIGLLVVALGTLVAYWDDISKAVGITRSETAKLNSAMGEAAAATKITATELNYYNSVVQDTSKSEGEREFALKKLKDAGIATDDVNIANANSLKELNDRTAQHIQLIQQRARVEAATQLIQEKTKEVIKAQNGTLDESLSFVDKWIVANTSLLKGYDAATETAQKRANKNVATQQKEIDKLTKVLADETEKLTKLEGLNIETSKKVESTLKQRTKAQEEADKAADLSQQKAEERAERARKILLDAELVGLNAVDKAKLLAKREFDASVEGFQEGSQAYIAAKKIFDDKIASIDKQVADENEKKRKEDADKQKEFQKELQNNLLKANEDYYKYQELQLVQNGATQEEFNNLELERLQTNLEAMRAINGENSAEVIAAEVALAAKKKEIRDKDLADKRAAEQQSLQLTIQGFAAIGELAEAFAGQSEAQQKKAFEIKKKASIAQAIVETLMAAQSAYASQMAIPTPDAPIRATIAAALAIASGIARVKKIEQTKFESKSGAAGGGGGGGNNPSAPNTTPVTGGLLPDMEQPGGFAGMGRVYVLEGDITKTQTRVRRVRNVSVV
jgi:hypothetical protein